MSTPERPLDPETLDELLSAELDGELDRAAVELGFTPEAARAALDAIPGIARRRAALARARALLAERPPLNPALELRLTEIALGAKTDELGAHRRRRVRREQSWRIVVAVGSAAAVVAGIVALVSAGNNTQSKSSSSAAVGVPKAAKQLPAIGANVQASVAFGDVSDPTVLVAKVRIELQQRTPAAAALPSTTDSAQKSVAGGYNGDSGVIGLQGPSGPTGATGPQGPTGPAGGSPIGATGAAAPGPRGLLVPQGPQGLQDGGIQGDESIVGSPVPSSAPGTAVARGADSVARARGLPGAAGPQGLISDKGPAVAAHSTPGCTTQAQRVAGAQSSPVLSGTGTAAGRPVLVVVFARAAGHEVFVLSQVNCAVITHQTLP